LSRQDEKQRLRRRLQEYAMQLAINNQWEEGLEINRQSLELGEDAQTYNRMGKALLELGKYHEALDAYQQTLRLNPINTIARRNIARLESLLARVDAENETPHNRELREQVDLRLFITEAGKTVLTTLLDVPRGAAVEALATGEKVELQVEENRIIVVDAGGNIIGRIEPKIGQRLAQLISGGNRYISAIVQSDPRQVRILIREIYRDPSQQTRTSFPARLIGNNMYEYLTTRYDYATDDLLEEEESPEEVEIMPEEYRSGDDEEEIGLEAIEKNISDDEESEE
jgi:tetratricopeptide (TPR) repeat protein